MVRLRLSMRFRKLRGRHTDNDDEVDSVVDESELGRAFPVASGLSRPDSKMELAASTNFMNEFSGFLMLILECKGIIKIAWRSLCFEMDTHRWVFMAASNTEERKLAVIL